MHIRPPADSVRRVAEPARPAWVAFPAYRPDAANALVPLPKAQGLMRLVEHTLNLSPFGLRGFETVAWLAQSCGCYDFAYSSLEAAVETFEPPADQGVPA